MKGVGGEGVKGRRPKNRSFVWGASAGRCRGQVCYLWEGVLRCVSKYEQWVKEGHGEPVRKGKCIKTVGAAVAPQEA